MVDLVVLFCYTHWDAVTDYHYSRLIKFNPSVKIVPVCGDVLPQNKEWAYHDWRWAHCDASIYNWYLSEKKIEAKRYICLEYDTLCNGSIKKFYEECFNADAASYYHFNPDKNPEYQWFSTNIGPDCPILFNPKFEKLAKYEYAMAPLNGVFLTKDSLELVIDVLRKESEALGRCFCEVRMGTALNMGGVKIQKIVSHKGVKHYSYTQKRIHPSFRMLEGLFHPVKVMPMNGESTRDLPAE